MHSERYTRYLKSPLWQRRRRHAILRAGNRCQRCNAVGVPLQVHHLHYRTLGHERPHDLLVVCLTCHPIVDKERRRRVALARMARFVWKLLVMR